MEIITLKAILTIATAQEMEGFVDTDKVTFNQLTRELTVKANQSTGKNFRLVHDGKVASVIVEGSDKTMTTSIHTIEEFSTEKLALARVEELGLEYPDGDVEENDAE